jgi:short-subunit dehydrogenase
MTDFAEQVVVVTGASSGIGRALCLALAPQRPCLVMSARDAGRLEQVAADCRGYGAQTLVVPADVGQEADCRGLIERAASHFGRLDVLINNAGQSMWALFEELRELALYEQLMRVNYLSCVYLSHAALPHLRRSRGRLAAVASVAGLTGVPTRTGYAASKHAVFGFFDSLRIELRGSGVSVTLVAPDFVVSEIHRRSLGPDGRPLGVSPMQEERLMSAEECARLTLRAIASRRRLAILSRRGRIGRFVRLLAPGLIDRIALRAVQAGR